MIYKYNNNFFWFENNYIICCHNGSSTLEYYSLINNKINDYIFFKEKENIDFIVYKEILSYEEFEQLCLQKRRDYKISLIIEDI